MQSEKKEKGRTGEDFAAIVSTLAFRLLLIVAQKALECFEERIAFLKGLLQRWCPE